MYIDFRKHSTLGPALLGWWRGLDVRDVPRLRAAGEASPDEEDSGDAGQRRGDRAGRAMLRRADSITAVVMTPAYQRLYRRLCQAGWPAQDWHDDRLAAAVGLIAHVEIDDDRPLPQAMSRRGRGSSEDDDRPPVSPLRFMRLLDSPDLDALFAGLRRVLPLLRQDGGVRADVRALATDVVNWGDAVKKRWAYGYEWPDQSSN